MVTERRHPGRRIAVDELRIDASDAGLDAGGTDDRRRRRAAVVAGAVAAALAAAAVVVAVVDPGRRDEQATSVPGPIRAVGRGASRAVLADVPSGFRVTAVRELDGGAVRPEATATLYRAPGAAVGEDPWVLTVLSPLAAHLPLGADFLRPARTVHTGQRSLALGQGALGDEVAAFDSTGGRVTVIANDLAPGLTEALAGHARIADGGVLLDAADLPAGLTPGPAWHLPRGLGPAAALADAAGPPDGWDIVYGSVEGAEIDVIVSSIAADEVAAVEPLSRFLLSDASHGVVRGHPAVFGWAGDTAWAVWTEGTTLLSVSLTGLGLGTVARVPGSLRLASDPDWDEAAWAATMLIAERARPGDTDPATAGPRDDEPPADRH